MKISPDMYLVVVVAAPVDVLQRDLPDAAHLVAAPPRLQKVKRSLNVIPGQDEFMKEL